LPESRVFDVQDGNMDDLELARRAALAGGDVGLRYAETLAELPRDR
jgi:hypothetical protein